MRRGLYRDTARDAYSVHRPRDFTLLRDSAEEWRLRLTAAPQPLPASRDFEVVLCGKCWWGGDHLRGGKRRARWVRRVLRPRVNAWIPRHYVIHALRLCSRMTMRLPFFNGEFVQTARNLETQTQTSPLTITASQKLGLRLRFASK